MLSNSSMNCASGIFNCDKLGLMFAVIVNQEAKEYSQECLNRVLTYLEIHNKPFEVFVLDSIDKPSEVYKRVLKSLHSDIILLGGDGSLRLLIQTAMDLNIKKPVGLIPIGRLNSSSECLEIPLNIEEACEIACIGFQYQISLGVVEPNDGKKYYFHHSANVGIEANIRQFLPLISGELIQQNLDPFKSIKRTLFEKPMKFDVHYLNNTLVGTSLIVGNGMLFDKPSNLRIRRLLSDKLQSRLLTSDKKVSVVEFLIRNRIGNYPEMKQIEQFKSEELQIHKPNIPILLDGDYVGSTPAKFSQLIGAYPVVSRYHQFEPAKSS